MSQNYTTLSNLYLQFGTDKAIPETFGEYVSYGSNRIIEGSIDLTKLTTTAIISSNTCFFPALPNTKTFIEKVDLIVEIAATTSTSATFDLGLIQSDRATVPSGYGTALCNAVAATALTPLGTITTISGQSTGYGSLIGSGPANATAPYYITAATGTGTFTAGRVLVRVHYHNLLNITTGSNITE